MISRSATETKKLGLKSEENALHDAWWQAAGRRTKTAALKPFQSFQTFQTFDYGMKFFSQKQRTTRKQTADPVHFTRTIPRQRRRKKFGRVLAQPGATGRPPKRKLIMGSRTGYGSKLAGNKLAFRSIVEGGFDWQTNEKILRRLTTLSLHFSIFRLSIRLSIFNQIFSQI